jgi:hypothetical protein
MGAKQRVTRSGEKEDDIRKNGRNNLTKHMFSLDERTENEKGEMTCYASTAYLKSYPS